MNLKNKQHIFRNIMIIGFFLIIGIKFVMGQPLNITIKDKKKETLVGATVQLIKLADSMSLFSVTNQNGIAVFENVANTIYSVNIRYLGFIPLQRTINVKPNLRKFEFQLQEEVMALGEVKVSANRPLIRQEDDKTIIDPEPLASTCTNTLEVLERTPGLFVDQDGSIFLNSATPAVLYINGREQKMSTQDIATVLRSLPPGSILHIEVMRTPSTKYDAASSGGIVNIVLKKGVKIGRFGSSSLGMNRGVAGNRFAGFSLNGSTDKSTAYLNINFSSDGQFEELNSTRFLALDTILNQSAETRSKSYLGYGGFGLSYDATKKLNISYDGRINGSIRRSDISNFTYLESPERHLLSENKSEIKNRSTFLSIQQDIGIKMKIDTLGSEWETKFGLNLHSNNSYLEYKNDFFFPIVIEILGEGDNQQTRQFMLFQSDLTYFLPRKIKIEAGIKSTIQDFDSESDYIINFNGDIFPDPTRTNAFNYSERISAAYGQASANLPSKILLKTGVRLEQTYMKGNQTIPMDTSFIVNRTDWFPYVYLSRRIGEVASYELRGFLIYRRTIGRPGYQSLNPYNRYVDQYLSETGNPALQPQFTDNMEANISFNETPIFAIGRNNTHNIFSSVVYKDKNHENVAIRTFDNVGQSKETYFKITGALPPMSKYFFVAGAQYNLNEYEGIYENQPLKFIRGSWRFFTFHSLSITQQTRLTMMGFMMLNGQQNFYELKTFGQLNFGLNQTFFDKKLTITLNARDVLRTMSTQFSFNQGSMRLTGNRYADNQRIGINIRYNFGVRKKPEHQQIPQMEAEE